MAVVNVEGMRARWDGLSERERWLVLVAAAAAIVLALTLTVWIVGGQLDELSDDNAQMRQALKDIDTYRESYQKAKLKSSQFESRIGHGGVQFALQGFLETAEKQSDVVISETNERPPQVLKNTKYIQRDVDLHIRKCNLEQLAKFLRNVENGPNLVVATGLTARVRDDKHEDLEVEMTISTWERAPDPKATKKSAGTATVGDGAREGKN